MKFKPLALAILSSALLIAGCSLDGDDGARGPQGNDGAPGDTGPQGNPGPQGEPGNRAIDLTILHMNDHHSHIEAETFDFDVSSLNLSARTESGGELEELEVAYGGFPMLVSLFDTLAGQSQNVLKLHAGDAITGTLFYTLFSGVADAAVMNQICFDAFALGNHEFDDGDSGLAFFLDALNSTACQTPALAANVVPADTSAINSGYIQPYTLVKREGEWIGIIGIDIAGKTKNSSQPDDGTEFLDETTTAQQFIDELKDMGVNKIILLTHYQFESDKVLAANLSGVDVIVGGDSHSLLGGDTFAALGFNPVGDYPTQVSNSDGDPVCVVQAWEYAHLMGKLEVSFDEEGVVTRCAGQPYMPFQNSFQYEFSGSETRSLNNSDSYLVSQALSAYPELVATIADAATSDLVASFASETEVLKQTVIGASSADLCLERFPGEGRSALCDVSATSAMGSDISNIVAKAFMTVTPTADIGIQNSGGVRVDLEAGDITIADAFMLLPFSNTLVTLEMTGQQVINVLEDALANTLDNAGSTGSYPYASGLRYDVDASQSAGNRVSNVEVNPRVAGTWTPINTAATYTVVTNNFIASGQDGYATFGPIFDAGNFVDTFTEYAQGFVDYVEGLTDNGLSLQKLPSDEYSTQSYIGRDGCNHSSETCTGF